MSQQCYSMCCLWQLHKNMPTTDQGLNYIGGFCDSSFDNVALKLRHTTHIRRNPRSGVCVINVNSPV